MDAAKAEAIYDARTPLAHGMRRIKGQGDWFYGDLGYIAFTFRAGKFESAKAQAEKQ